MHPENIQDCDLATDGLAMSEPLRRLRRQLYQAPSFQFFLGIVGATWTDLTELPQVPQGAFCPFGVAGVFRLLSTTWYSNSMGTSKSPSSRLMSDKSSSVTQSVIGFLIHYSFPQRPAPPDFKPAPENRRSLGLRMAPF